MDHEIITQDGEIIETTAIIPSSSMAVQLQKAEIDQLVSTARAFPRSLKHVQARILNMATLDEESAEECIYALPRGGKPIRGPSIRFAEILKQSYGNCQAAARVVHVDKVEKYVEAEGVFIDLETNSKSTARVRRRISGRNGAVFNDDMIIVTGNAACSIAMRNAILAGVPKPLWRKAYDQVQATITGDVTTLSENREKAFKALAAFGVKPEQVFSSLGVEGVEDITVDHIATLRGMYSALKNGEATVEEMFVGTIKALSEHQKVANPLEDAIDAPPVAPAPEVASETESLSTAFPDETEQHSSATPLADETGSGDVPRTAPDPSPSEPNSDDETGEPASETADGQTVASSPVDPNKLSEEDRAWLLTAARMLIPCAAPNGDPDVVRRQYGALLKTLTPPTISKLAIGKAVSISKRLVAVCEATEELDLDLLAGIAGCTVGDLANG